MQTRPIHLDRAVQSWVRCRAVTGSGRPLALAGLLAFLYLYPFPYFEDMRSANELPRIYLTSAMVDEGRFAIDTGVRAHGATVDVSPSGGHHYSNKAPGSSMLAVPVYVLVKAVTGGEPSLAHKTWAFRVATGVLPTLLFLLLLWRFLARFTGDGGGRPAALAGYAAGSMAMIYSVLFVSHQLSAVCIAALLLFVRYTKSGRAMRALAQDKEVTYLMGVDIDRIASLGFAIGAALAGLAGGLLVTVFAINSGVGTAISIKSFIMIMIGGAGVVSGAILGGFVLGFAEAVGYEVFPGSITYLLIFIGMILFLIVRPQGIMGRPWG